MNLNDCHNFQDFRKLARKRLPSPIFHYIDGAADDEVTYNRNTAAYNDADLIPNVLRGVEDVDLSTTIFGKKIDLKTLKNNLVDQIFKINKVKDKPFYSIPHSAAGINHKKKIKLKKLLTGYKVDESIKFGDSFLKPLRGGEIIKWFID